MLGEAAAAEGTPRSWLAADAWEKTHSCPIAMEMSQQQVEGRGKREGSSAGGCGAQADPL